MTALKEVIENIIYNENRVTNRVFVVSAFAGVTNQLLENKKTKAPGVYQKLAAREELMTRDVRSGHPVGTVMGADYETMLERSR